MDSLTLTKEEVNEMLNKLAEIPYKYSASIIDYLTLKWMHRDDYTNTQQEKIDG